MTAYIELPQGFSVNQIEITSIVVGGTLHALPKPTEIGDYDMDGVPDFMVKIVIKESQKIFTGKPTHGAMRFN